MILPMIILGLLFGWGVNYLSDVLPTTRRFSTPACHACQTTYQWKDYLTLRACTHCGKPRHWRTWIVIGALLAATIYIGTSPATRYDLIWKLLLLPYFAVVTVIDLEHRLILHPVSLVGLVIGLGAGSMTHGWDKSLIGAIAGFGIMMFLYLLGVLFAKWRAKRMGIDDDEEAFGFGDVALATVLGATLGWPLIWFGLLLGVLLSGIFIVLILLILLVTGKYKTLSIYVPYGPYLIMSATILIYFPNWISGLGLK